MSIRYILVLFKIVVMIVSQIFPFSFSVQNNIINNKPEKEYTLKINMNASNIKVSNTLSFDKLFGFEKTSSMLKRHKGLYAVNGMFYDDYGIPSGIIVKDNEVISMTSINTPTVIIDEHNKVDIVDLKVQGTVIVQDKEIVLSGVNCGVNKNEWVIFNKWYGSNTRVNRVSVNYIISKGIIEDIIISSEPVNIEKDKIVLTTVTSKNPILNIGDAVNIKYKYTGTNLRITEAFQSGGWLVNNSENVAKDYQNYIGYTTAPNPRTLIGITTNNKLVIKVIDGRLKGVSLGVSGKEAADIMLDEDCVKAVYLDGGASSTIVSRKNVINKPSNKGKERAVAHALVISKD
jgi:exopolysaccharide biosynthesis protein